LKRPKRRRDLKIDTSTVPRRTIRRSPPAQQLPNLWWKRQQHQGIRALESALKIDGLHVVCPPFFIATRQHCGGVYREELGGPWVAFFLCCVWNIGLGRKNVIKRAGSA
jgi:hypothetical protein